MTGGSGHDGPVLREAVMNLHRRSDPARARIVSNESCTASSKSAGFVSHTVIDVSGTGLVGVSQPGQSIGVQVPGEDEHGKPHKLRLYSLSSPTSGEGGNPTLVATTVKRLIDQHWEHRRLFLGLASNHICDLGPGEEILVTGPVGKRFLLPRDPEGHDYVFFATGTGIAPFRGMVLDLLGGGCGGRIVLVAGAAYATDLLYDGLFRELAREHENFRYVPTVSRERQEDGGERMYVQDRLVTHREELVGMLSSERTLVYVCGIAGMEVGIFRRMAEVLDGEVVGRYLEVDPGAGEPGEWERGMVGKVVRPTGRVLLEVYD